MRPTSDTGAVELQQRSPITQPGGARPREASWVPQIGTPEEVQRTTSDQEGATLPRCCQGWIAEQAHTWARS